MIIVEDIIKLIKEGLDSFFNSEECLKRKALGLDLPDFSADFTGTHWDLDEHIKSVDYLLTQQDMPVMINVDLEFFNVGNSVEILVCKSGSHVYYISDEDLEKTGLCKYWYSYVGLDIEYHVVSQKKSADRQTYEYYSKLSHGESDSNVVCIDVDIVGGIHTLYSSVGFVHLNSCLDISSLKHLKNCIVGVDSVFLFYEDADILLKNNIRVMGDYKLDLGVVCYNNCEDKVVEQLLSIMDYVSKHQKFIDRLKIRLFRIGTFDIQVYLVNIVRKLFLSGCKQKYMFKLRLQQSFNILVAKDEYMIDNTYILNNKEETFMSRNLLQEDYGEDSFKLYKTINDYFTLVG